jgi:hypothetical protein
VDTSALRGFNYSGSWGTSGLDLWQHHDNGLMALEVARGKRYFPGWNVARWWLSHESYSRNPERFLANLDAGLDIFAAHGIAVIPVLFNRWRDALCDFGGVYLEHIIPELGAPDSFSSTDAPDTSGLRDARQSHLVFRAYIDGVVSKHRSDERILMWDICNEPLSGGYPLDPDSMVVRGEVRWLEWCAALCRKLGATQPITIGNFMLEAVRLTATVCDVLSFHPYYMGNVEGYDDRDRYERYLDEAVAFAQEVGKPILASEVAWGSMDDAERVDLMSYSLTELTSRSMGFVAHALHHSLIADLHRAEYGPIGLPGRLEFINADGSLRAGHEIYNSFSA